MRKTKAGTIGVAALAAMLAASVACTPTAGPGSSDARVTRLKVGITPDYPPLVYKQGNDLVGIEIDLAREVGKSLEKDVAFVEMAWDELIPALKKGTIDVIMSGMSVTDGRKARVRFVEPYMSVGQMVLIRSEDAGRFGRHPASYGSGARVGYVKGTTGELFALEHLKHLELRPMPNVDRGIRALRSGQTDAFIHDAPTIWRVSGDPDESELMGLYWPLTEESLAWAVRKSDVVLHNELDAEVRRWKRNGTLQLVLDRWMRVRVEVR